MKTTTALRMTTVAALTLASVVQGASATSQRVPVVTSAVTAPAATGGRLRAGQFGGGFGGGPDVALTSSFDKDRDGRLNTAERRAARDYSESQGLNRGRGGFLDVPPGPTVTPESVRPYPTTPFYDTNTLRTLFLTFEDNEWERDLLAFRRTDVDVPGTLMVDGRSYANVGVQFHGNSSFSGVPMGLKHSLRIALDSVNASQDVQGYNTLLLLNAHEDPSFLHTVLALQIARDYIPAPQANLVRVVINGESWGIFANQQHFNKDLIREGFKTTEGARWKVAGTRGYTGSGLSYLGDDASSYRSAFEIKSKDEPAAWTALIKLTRTLEQTPPERLEAALAPMLDIDGVLKFLAVENVLVNSDGYWAKASDYSLYMAPTGRFHLLPYDVNSTFMLDGRRGESPNLDPLAAMYDSSKPLAAKLLVVPSLRAKYLGYVREVANKWMDWNTLGPLVTRYHAMLDADVRSDTRKLYSYSEFTRSPDLIRAFAERRRSALTGAGAGR